MKDHTPFKFKPFKAPASPGHARSTAYSGTGTTNVYIRELERGRQLPGIESNFPGASDPYQPSVDISGNGRK